MVDYQAISIAFAGISIGVAALYYALNIRHQRETRQTQLFMQIFDRLNDKESRKQFGEFIYVWEWKDFDDFWDKYGPERNIDDWASFNSFNAYYEGIGVMIKRGLIDPMFVDDIMSGEIIRVWEKFEPIAREWRRRQNWPQAFEWNEYLYNEIKAIVTQQHPELKT
jgi:hypothetical protein